MIQDIIRPQQWLNTESVILFINTSINKVEKKIKSVKMRLRIQVHDAYSSEVPHPIIPLYNLKMRSFLMKFQKPPIPHFPRIHTKLSMNFYTFQQICQQCLCESKFWCLLIL